MALADHTRDVRQDRARHGLFQLHQAKLFTQSCLVVFGKNIVERVATIGHEPLMEVWPVSLAFEVRIDSREWTAHGHYRLYCLTSWSA